MHVRLVVLLSLLPAATQLAAATFVVNSTANVPDANPGDGICATSTGVCTLAAALDEAASTNNALILLPATAPGQPIDARSAWIRAAVTIRGAGENATVVSGMGSSLVFWISTLGTSPGDVVISDLTIRDGAAGIDSGGGISNTTCSRLVIERVRITNCTAGGGGGISSSGPLDVRSCLIDNNHANGIFGFNGGSGGGIAVSTTCTGADLSVIRDTTLYLNTATVSGGGLWASRGEVHVVNSTLSQNSAPSGGGIFVDDGQTYLENATLTENRASSAGGGVFNGAATTSLNFANTILAFNYRPAGDFLTYDDCYGYLTSYNFNIMSPGGPTCTVQNAGVTYADPHLGLIQDNGGGVPTHALLAGSPAIDGGNPAGCVSQLATLSADQRGTMRPLGPACDVGAYERGPCGDVNGDGVVSPADVVYLVRYLFGGGSAPAKLWNVNGDSAGGVADVMALVNYFFANGPSPVCSGT